MKKHVFTLSLAALICAPVANLAPLPAMAAQDAGLWTYGDAAPAPADAAPSDASLPEGYEPSVAAPSADAAAAPVEAAPAEAASAEPAPAVAEPVLPPAPPVLRHGLVSSAHPEASEAGMEMLRKGGSAIDAAMAMMLALTVVEPQSSGIGGGGFLLHQDAANGLLETIDGRETAPARADEGLFLDAAGQPLPFAEAFRGGRSVGTPGNIRLMALAHQKWGKLPWKDLFTPAIQLAEGGFEVNAALAARLQGMKNQWRDFPEAQKLFWLNGEPVPEGTLVRNPALAGTLERLALMGPDAFYAGQTGREIVRAVQGAPVNPGLLDLNDLSAYAARERPALCVAYRVYKVCGMGPPSSGAVTIFQILGMIERFDLAKTGKDDMQNWHLIAEAMRLAYADREKYLADPDFVDVPVEGLLEPAYIKARSALISPKKARGTYVAGSPKLAPPRTEAVSSEVEGTSHFVAVDAAGNVASMTSTIEGPFGSQLLAAGFFLNNELTDFTFAPAIDGAPVANRVQAGKRPLSSMAPTIVYDASGKPVLTLGSAGGKRIIMHVAKTLIGVLDFGLPLADAVALPNIFFGGDSLLVEKDSLLSEKSADLARFGHIVVASDLDSKVNGAQWSENAGWVAVADPRSEGKGMAQ